MPVYLFNKAPTLLVWYFKCLRNTSCDVDVCLSIQDSLSDAKSVVGKLSKLRNGLMTDKPLEDIVDTYFDACYWKLKKENYL